MGDWRLTGSRGDPWRVTISPVGDGRVVHLHIGDVMVVLEAHKLGSALQAASGLDDVPDSPPLREACPNCEGKGCPTCDGRGWRINPNYFRDESPAGEATDG